MQLTVAIIGYGISRTLLTSLMSLPQIYPELPCDIHLKTICGRNREAVEKTVRSFNFQKSTGNWMEIIEDPEAGKHILSGIGATGDLGSHAIDLARYLLGEPSRASGFTRIIVAQRSGRGRPMLGSGGSE